jgi:2-succinyl-6-hydroxy-2,4-cyclohexadiene-1-carboxylate synthase
MTRIPVNGIHLNVEVEGTGPALMLLHGFTGDISTWEPLLPAFRGFQTIRVDLIGHGASDAPEDPERYTMAHGVQDLVALLDHLDVGQAALLGYSLGGRVALHFALEAQERLWALILESASPGIEDAAERAARVASDSALADDLLRNGIEAFVDRWQAQALFASQLNLPAATQEKQRRSRLGQKPLGLANSLRGMGAGRQEYLMPRLEELKIPTLLMAGELDTKYSGLAYDMAALIPDTAVVVTPKAGHAVHLEQPKRFQRLAGTFLSLLPGEEMDVQRIQDLRGSTPRLGPAQERHALGEA